MLNEPREPSESMLPHWVLAQIEELGIENIEVWTHSKISALGGRCVIELMGTLDGEAKLKEYFARAIGR